jgi:hypothetical protein
MPSKKFVDETMQLLAGRSPITPDDLPPFGALVTTSHGFMGEILGWYSAIAGSDSLARQRMALVMVIETPGASATLPEGTQMPLGYLFENWIARSESQRFPRFARWIRERAVSGMIGRKWKEE